MTLRDFFSRANPFASGSQMVRHALPGGIVVNTATGEWSESDRTDPRHATRVQLVKSSPIQASVRLISTSIADLITNTLYIVNDDDDRVDPNTAQREILNLFRYSPNSNEDGHSFVANAVCDLLMDGNCLIGIERVGQRVNRLFRMIPQDAKVQTNRLGEDYYTGSLFMVNEGGIFNRSNMIHAKAVNFEGYSNSDDRKGFVKGPIHTLQRTMLINGYLDQYIVDYFTSDANGLRMFIRATDAIGREDVNETRRYVEEVAKRHKGVAFLREALEPLAFQTSAIDQSMAALRTFQIREASRIFGVPVPMLGEEKSGTNIAALKQDFWQHCIKPHANTLLSAMSMKLLNQRNASKGFRFAIDPTEMIKGDPETMAKLLLALGDAQRPGPLSPTEWRRAGGWETQMPPENETDRRVYKDLAARQAGLPSSVRTPGAGDQINNSDGDDNDDQDDKDQDTED